MGSSSIPADADRAIKDFLASADPALVERFVAGELTLAFAQVNPVVNAIVGCSIEEAFARLDAMPARERNKYGASTLVKASLPTGKALIDRILTDLYGRTYVPQTQPKKTTSRARPASPAGPSTPKVKPLSPDEAVRQLQTVTTEVDARKILAGMKRSKPDHQQVAESFGVVYRDNTTIKVLTDHIVDMVLAARRFEPLQRGGMR